MIVVSFLMLVGMAACTSQSTAETSETAQPEMAQASYITADTFDDLIDQSPLIVIGQVVERGEIVNPTRDPDDPEHVHPSIFVLGQIYHVEVERVPKGSDHEAISVMQPEGWVNAYRTAITDQSIEESRASYPHIPMSSDATYLMFLRPLQGFDHDDYLTGGIHPWRFTISGDGIAVPESPWYGAEEAFPPMPVEQIITEIERVAGSQPR